MLEVAKHIWVPGETNTVLQTVMPPRLAAMCSLDGIDRETLVVRLAMPYSAHLRKGHRVLFQDVHLSWWISWIGYLVLFFRRVDADTDMQCNGVQLALPKLAVITMVYFLGHSLHTKKEFPNAVYNLPLMTHSGGG